MFELSPGWKEEYPDALVGVLAMRGVRNPDRHPELDRKKEALEEELRARYATEDRRSLRKHPVLAAYDAYYRRFGKSYHVQHQLESVAFKGKPIPSIAALVEAMFMAELKNLLLTAGHDWTAVEGPLRIEVAMGTESYVRMNGEEQLLKAGDMMIRDQVGPISSILYGPDRRTRIRPDTEDVVFTVYAPPGIARQDLERHLEEIRDNVHLVAPEATVALLELFGGG
jgi:DNA/RNA-binding domain of Phe-tRNA-synthetase-like protein